VPSSAVLASVSVTKINKRGTQPTPVAVQWNWVIGVTVDTWTTQQCLRLQTAQTNNGNYDVIKDSAGDRPPTTRRQLLPSFLGCPVVASDLGVQGRAITCFASFTACNEASFRFSILDFEKFNSRVQDKIFRLVNIPIVNKNNNKTGCDSDTGQN